MAYVDNPAGRLLAVLQTARSAVPHDRPAKQGWASAFGVDVEDIGALLGHGARLIVCAAEVRRAVESYTDEDPDLLLKHFPEVERTLEKFQSFGSMRMEQFFNGLDPKAGEHSLELCSALLHRKAKESVPGADKIIDLRSEVEALIGDVQAASDLTSELKGWIIGHLSEVMVALNNFHLYGVRDLQDAADKLTGGIIARGERAISIKKSGIVDRLAKFIVALDLVLNLAANTNQLGAGGNQPQPSPAVVILQKQIGSSSGVDIIELPYASDAHAPSK